MCSAALGALAPTEEAEGRGISWRPPTYSLLVYNSKAIFSYFTVLYSIGTVLQTAADRLHPFGFIESRMEHLRNFCAENAVKPQAVEVEENTYKTSTVLDK